jgi:hypothetical protein
LDKQFTGPEEIQIMPEGTVTVYLDYEDRAFIVGCEPEPDEDDLEIAWSLADRYGNGEPPEEWEDQGTVVFRFPIGLRLVNG